MNARARRESSGAAAAVAEPLTHLGFALSMQRSRRYITPALSQWTCVNAPHTIAPPERTISKRRDPPHHTRNAFQSRRVASVQNRIMCCNRLTDFQ
ncbi:hypothetical protein EVAR_3586_1 [Eumeta japonica]|uniref:Uncharacterized protein n=1 Tax=Eumeta variegata TaxID=151549 RepID=A0A4C1SYI0_EUMVA|nr:hypothetical protein EVAR_3586_1 [Eumeta japonica]